MGKKGSLRALLKQGYFYSEHDEALAQVAQRSCGCSIPGGPEGQVAWGPGQPELLVGSPARGRGLELSGL